MDDYTLKSVLRQLEFLNCASYDVGIYNRSTDVMEKRVFTSQMIIRSLGFLKHRNIHGHDIFIRPHGESGYVFVDDISRSDINNMDNDGCNLAICLESSPLNYQGWLRVSKNALSPNTASSICRYLARTYNGDPRSSDWMHYGRLAGFTNRKPQYINDAGHYPFVSIYDTSNSIHNNPAALIEMSKRSDEMLESIKRNYSNVSRPFPRSCEGLNADFIYLREIKAQKKIWDVPGKKYNSSDADWNAVIKMLYLGFTQEQVSQVLYQHSESVAKRSTTRANDYVARTILNASSVVHHTK